jgi:hypothetical protein
MPAPRSAALTEPQFRLLQRVQDQPRIFNGRATRVIEALETAGLVTAGWDADMDHTKGRLRWRITVTAVPGLCPGSGRPWGSGTGNPICPACHAGPGGLRAENIPHRERGRWTGQVPAHIRRTS